MKRGLFFAVNLVCLLMVVAEHPYTRKFCTGYVAPHVIQKSNKRDIITETPHDKGGEASVDTGRELPVPRYLPHHNITLEAELSLEVLARELASFVQELDFDAAQFEAQSTSLRRKVAGITSWVEVMFSKNGQIMARLEFLHRLFCTLNSSAAYMRYFTGKGAESQLLRSLIHLKVRLLSLYDFLGEPGLSRPNFEECISMFSHRLDTWDEMHKSMQNIPESVESMIKAQFDDSRAILQHLASYISEKSYGPQSVLGRKKIELKLADFQVQLNGSFF